MKKGFCSLRSLFFCVVGLVAFVWASQVHAQSFLSLLNSDAQQRFQFQGTGRIPKKKLERRLKQVQQMLQELRKSELRRSKEMDKKKQRYLRYATEYKQPPQIDYLKKDKEILDYYAKIVDVSEKTLSSLSRLQATYEAREQILQSLIRTYENYLQTEKGLEKNIQNYYVKGGRVYRLRRDDRKLTARIKKLEAKAKKNAKEHKKVQFENNKNKEELDKVRLLLVTIATKANRLARIELPQESKKPEKKTDKPQRRRRLSRRERRELAKKKAAEKKRKRELAMRKMKLERQQQRNELTQKAKETYYRTLFELYRMRDRINRLRLKDLDVESEQIFFNIRVFSYIKQLMDEELERLASTTRQGLWYKRQIPINSAMFQEIFDHSQKVLKEGPDNAAAVGKTLYKNIMSYGALQGGAIVLGIILLFLLILFGERWLKRWMEGWLKKIEEESKEDEETPFLWQLLTLTMDVVIATIPYLNLLLLFPFVVWLVGPPEAWQTMILTLTFMIPLLRISWVLTHRLFATDPKERLLKQLDDKIAVRFRRIIRVFTFFAFLYVPFLQGVKLLGYPESLVQLLSIVFYACLLVCFLLLFVNKKAILHLIPEEAPFASSIITYTNQFYSLISFAAVAIFAAYAYGYINFAAYLVRGFVVTFLLGFAVIGLHQLLIRVSKRLLKINKDKVEQDDKEIYEQTRKWNDNLYRLIQIVSSVMLFLFAVAALFEIWRIGKGYRTAIQLINSPLVNVKDTQITLISIVKMVISMSVAVWLSRFAKAKFSEYLYPALDLSLSDQHASNTVVGYLILALGLLFGLQWMGMGIGVLAVFAGVIGIGVGFGLQNIASNFISGLIITFSKPIKVNDLIEVGDYIGIVKEISTRSTTIMTQDSRLVLIPNADILTTKVINWSEGAPYIWMHVGVGVAYGSPVQLAKELLLDIARRHPRVLRRPAPIVRFDNFGDSSLDFILRFAIKNPAERWDICSDLRFEIDKLFQENDLEIPFPQRDINIDPALQESLQQAFNGKDWSSQPEPELREPNSNGEEQQTNKSADDKQEPQAAKSKDKDQKLFPDVGK